MGGACSRRARADASGEDLGKACVDCVEFDPASPAFDQLHDGTAEVLAESNEPLFHEAGVWMPQTSEWLVTSNRLLPDTPETHVRISAINTSGAWRRLVHLEEKILMGNGGTTDFAGGAYLCSQGLGDVSGALWHINPDLSDAQRVGPPDGLVLNSLNDVVVHKGSGWLLFTDPAYGAEVQGFRTTFNEAKALWAVHPKNCDEVNTWNMVIDDHEQPNGVCLSIDEKTAYVTDVWHGGWHNNPDVKLRTWAGPEDERSLIEAYDVKLDQGKLQLTNRRLFVDLRKEEGASGFPDGIKCDEMGNVYCGCGDGVRVYSPTGKFLGRFVVEGGAANLCFGGPDGNILLVLNETKALAIKMKVKGALA